jgi:hypothetical protein
MKINTIEDLVEGKIDEMHIYVRSLKIIKKVNTQKKILTITKKNTTKSRPSLFYKEILN